MAFIRYDRCASTSTSTGTGPFTLGAAVTAHSSIQSVAAVGDTFCYVIAAVDSNGVETGEFETGLGTYSSTNTLTRTSVIRSSNSNSTVSFSSGTKRVYLSALSRDFDLSNMATGGALPIGYGGTGATTQAGAQTALGLAAVATSGSAADLTSGNLPLARLAGGTGATGSTFLCGDYTWKTPAGSGDALTANPLSQFASTTSAQLASVLSDETGNGSVVFNNGPSLTSPRITSALMDTNGNELFIFTATASAVNELTYANAATGNSPTFTCSGSDSVVGLNIVTKGGGTVQVNSQVVATRTATETLTNKTLGSPTLSGIVVRDGAEVITVNAMGALVIDVTKALNTKSISADSTFTFSGTPGASHTWFEMFLANTSGSAVTVTIPSSWSMTQSVAITSFRLPGSAKCHLVWRYDGTTYFLFGEPVPQAEVICIPIGDETTTITTGAAKVTFRMPFAMNLTALPRASLTTASSSGTPTFDINEGGTSILSTKLTIDANEKTSTTAATAAVLSDTVLADDAEITIDVDVAGTGAAGAKIYLIGTR